MPWISLFTAGVFEVAFAALLARASLRESLALGLMATVCLLISVGLLWSALRDLPVHVAYPIWTAIGVGGVVAISILTGARVSGVQTLGLMLVISGVLLLNMSHPTTGGSFQ